MRNFIRKILERVRRHYALPDRLDMVQEALGRIESALQTRQIVDIRQTEFKVFSQWGEDGIVDYLTRSVPILNRCFVEFGVENYTEANTLFLLKHRGWSGLVIDGSRENIKSIQEGRVFWKYDLRAECSFITPQNINTVISGNRIVGDIGLLSIDIDGNDYWVWEAIACITPRIVICEYNSLFGPTASISIPFQANFQRSRAHYSNMYYGASISALTYLAGMRGYSLVAGNSAGNNVFFVRNDCLGPLQRMCPAEAYVAAAFREARGADGEVQFLSFEERQREIADLPVVDVVSGVQSSLREAL